MFARMRPTPTNPILSGIIFWGGVVRGNWGTRTYSPVSPGASPARETGKPRYGSDPPLAAASRRDQSSRLSLMSAAAAAALIRSGFPLPVIRRVFAGGRESQARANGTRLELVATGNLSATGTRGAALY